MQSLLLITSGEKMFVVVGEWDCQNWVYEGLNESDSRSVVSDPGIEPRSPSFQADALTSEPPGKLLQSAIYYFI